MRRKIFHPLQLHNRVCRSDDSLNGYNRATQLATQRITEQRVERSRITMPVINETCPECGGSLEIGFGNRCLGGQLVWSASHHCNDCEHAVEEDSWDSIPEDYRQLELQHDGVRAIQLPHGLLNNSVQDHSPTIGDQRLSKICSLP